MSLIRCSSLATTARFLMRASFQNAPFVYWCLNECRSKNRALKVANVTHNAGISIIRSRRSPSYQSIACSLPQPAPGRCGRAVPAFSFSHLITYGAMAEFIPQRPPIRVQPGAGQTFPAMASVESRKICAGNSEVPQSRHSCLCSRFHQISRFLDVEVSLCRFLCVSVSVRNSHQ